MSAPDQQPTLNPFVAGYRRGMANLEKTKAAAAANPQADAETAQRIAGGVKAMMKWGLVLLAISFAYHLATAPDEKDMTFEQLAQHSKFTAERECDRAAERRATNPSSYDSDLPTSTVLDGNDWLVTANFRAMNDFGAMLDHNFVCRYDFTRKIVTKLELARGTN